MDKLTKANTAAPVAAGTEIPTLNNPVAAETKKASSTGAVLLALLALLTALAGAGGSYYLWIQQQQVDFHLQGVIQQASEKLDQSERSVDQLQVELHQAALAHDKQQQSLQTEINQLQKQLSSQHIRLQLLSTTDRSEWQLAELEYLLRLTNQRILVGGEIRGAEALLVSADQIIRELDDIALYSVRKSIASDLATVQAVTELDIQGIYVQLLALAEQVDKLPLFNTPENKAAGIESKLENKMLIPAPASDASWLEKTSYQLGMATENVIAMLGIRHRDYSVEPLLPPETHFYLRQNIQLKFEQAKSALMAGQQDVYQQSLADVQSWLAKYYQLAGHSSQVVMTSLKELQAIKVIQTLPDISSSLRALKSYLALRYKNINPPVQNNTTVKPSGANEPAIENQRKGGV